MKVRRDWFFPGETQEETFATMDTDFEPLHKPIAYTVQFALDKVRPPVKPGVSHGAILKNVSK
jgi:hypothetical protein